MGRYSDKVRKQLVELRKAHPGKTDQELLDIARHKAGETADPKYDISSKFKSASERKIANSLLQKYLNDYAIETISERNTLTEIIYLEVLQIRLQEKLNELYDNENKALPLNYIDTVHKNSDAIVRLKTTLGLNKSKDKKSAYDVLQHLNKRFKVWREQNQASRTIKCPYCSKFVFLKMRTEAWEALKHPFFRDNMIYNKHLFKHFGKKIEIDRDFVAGVLETSPDYVDWLQTKTRQQDQTDKILDKEPNEQNESEATADNETEAVEKRPAD